MNPNDTIPNTGGAVAVATDVVVEERPQLTEEEISEQAAAKADRVRRLDEIGSSLESMKETAIRYRGDFEQEWVEAYAQYDEGAVINGGDRATKEIPADNSEDYRRTKDNITRPAVLMVTSRVADMLFPTSDRNWDLTASPDAEMPKDLLKEEVEKYLKQIAETDAAQPKPAPGPDGQPPAPAPGQPGPNGEPPPAPTPEPVQPGKTIDQLTFDERETIEQKLAEKRCMRMRNRIDDQLQESSYAAHGRDTIADGAMYGTGVIKGPFAKRRRARVYDQRTKKWVAKYIEVPTPAVTYVDLFNFYPMPCRRIADSAGVFELHLSTSEMIRKLVHQPGFDPEQIARALKDENRSVGSLSQSILYRIGVTSRAGMTASLLENRYALWEFHGPLPKQGIVDFVSSLLAQDKVSDDIASALIAEVQDDPMVSMNCECWMVNGIVIKLALEPVASIEHVYHVYNYEERPDTLFGKGVPRVMRDDQLATTQLWQAMMLNAMMSAGLQIGVKKGALSPVGPAGGASDLTCTKPRVWAFNDEIDDIRKAFQAFEVPSVLDKLMPLYERSKKNSEEHIVLPSIVQGDPTNSVQTSSGLAMLMNAGNIVTRRLAKGWDDNITSPLLTGFFDWNMDHGPDDCKGDYIVIPRGSSHLLVKDVQSQRFLFALQTYSTMPKLESQMKWEEWGRQGLTIMDLDANRLLYSEDEIKQNERMAAANPPPPDAQTLLAQARVKEAEARAQAAGATVELNNSKLELSKQETEAVAASRTAELASRERVAQLNYMAAIAKLDSAERQAFEKIRAGLESEGIWARLEAGKMAQTERRDAVEIAVESPNPRLA